MFLQTQKKVLYEVDNRNSWVHVTVQLCRYDPLIAKNFFRNTGIQEFHRVNS